MTPGSCFRGIYRERFIGIQKKHDRMLNVISAIKEVVFVEDHRDIFYLTIS